MRVAFWSEEGSSIAWARRLFDEGTDVLVYTKKPHARLFGENIVPRATSIQQWLAWGNADRNTIWFCDCTDSGDLFDRLRRAGKLVVGAGSFMDKLEMDRAFGDHFAESHGIKAPPTKSFGSVREAVAYMRATKKQELGDGGWAWKPNRNLGTRYSYVGDTEKVTRFCERVVIPKFGDRVSCIVQERIPGVALSTARWWNGNSWTGPYEATLEEKKFMDGDVGPSTGCSLNTLWFYTDENPKIAQALKFEELAASFRAKQAPPGLYDINSIVNEHGAYFLEWTPRLGIDSELTSQRAFTNLTDVLYNVALGRSIDDFVRVNTCYHGVRVTVPPYPSEDPKLAELKIASGTQVDGLTSLWHGDFVIVGVRNTKEGLEVADPYGFVGMAIAEGRNVEKAYAAIAKTCKSLDIPDKQYRTDGAKIVTADVKNMHATGWETTRYMIIDEKKEAA